MKLILIETVSVLKPTFLVFKSGFTCVDFVVLDFIKKITLRTNGRHIGHSYLQYYLEQTKDVAELENLLI